jgi:phenylacetic acid degradation operon negative regulatory protein
MYDEILSRLKMAPTSRFIYSSLAFYATATGGELPGSWFTRALSRLGIAESAVRQTLYRMEQDGELVSRKVGRKKMYAPTSTTRVILDVGSLKMTRKEEAPWDGSWTLIHFRFDEATRIERDRLKDVLIVEGFALLGRGLYIHPRNRSATVLKAIRSSKLSSRVHIFRGTRLDAALQNRKFVESLWNLNDIALRYREFTSRFSVLKGQRKWLPELAAALRFALVFEFLEVAWDDPDLPKELLPASWPGQRAQALVDELYRRLTPAARAFGDAILAELS